MFLVGITIGSVLSPAHQSEPMQIASME